jgi:hypothetical protein
MCNTFLRCENGGALTSGLEPQVWFGTSKPDGMKNLVKNDYVHSSSQRTGPRAPVFDTLKQVLHTR